MDQKNVMPFKRVIAVLSSQTVRIHSQHATTKSTKKKKKNNKTRNNGRPTRTSTALVDKNGKPMARFTLRRVIECQTLATVVAVFK
jgi:type IV secretory pathway protease TraF